MTELIDENTGRLAVNIITEIFKSTYKEVKGWVKEKDMEHDFLGRAAKKYGDKMIDRFNFVRIFGMSKPVPLKDLYVRVRILEKITEETRLKEEDLKTFFDWENRKFGKQDEKDIILANQVANKYDKFIVLGKPGAGKTTFLKHLTLMNLEGSAALNVIRMPIFISLKELSDKGIDLIGFIVEQFDICNFEDARPFIVRMLDLGKCIILFDGLDEVDKKNQNNIIQEIIDFSDKFSENQFVISCRVAAYNHSFTKFTDVEIADFNDDQIEIFIKNWFKQEPDIFKSCWGKIISSNQLKELATSPLLLTLLCVTYDSIYEFPTNRAELYKESIDALLKKWDSTRRIIRGEIYRGLSLRRKESLFSSIAIQFFIKEEYFFREVALVRYIEEYIKNFPEINDSEVYLDAEGVLNAIEAQHGILIPRAKNIHSFSHLTFQEYFTAKNLIDNPSEYNTNLLLSNFSNLKWREVILLYVNMLDNADDFVMRAKEQIDEILVGKNKLKSFLSSTNYLIKDKTISKLSRRALGLLIGIENCYYGNKGVPDLSLINNLNSLLMISDLKLYYFKTKLFISNKNNQLSILETMSDFESNNRKDSSSIETATIKELQNFFSAVINGENEIKKFRFVMDYERASRLSEYIKKTTMLFECLQTEIYLSKEVRERILDSLLLAPE